MGKINIKIEGVPYQVEEGMTILQAARQCGYEIPTLCSFKDGECSRGSCRVCLVEATGARGLVASCVYPVSEGMEVRLSTPKVLEARRASVELLLSNHATNCQACDKNGKCELLYVAKLVGAREGRFAGEKTPATYDDLTPSIIRDSSKCILCGRCIVRCEQAHGKGVLGFINRGFDTIVGPVDNISLAESPCLMCGQCVSVCPTGALMSKPEDEIIYKAMSEGKQSHKDNKIMNQRDDTYEGRELSMEPHVKLLPQKAGADDRRIYYCYDHELDKIIVGRVGMHLKTAGTSRMG